MIVKNGSGIKVTLIGRNKKGVKVKLELSPGDNNIPKEKWDAVKGHYQKERLAKFKIFY